MAHRARGVSCVALIGRLLAVVTWCVACASSKFDGRVFRDGDLAFELSKVPRGYRPLQTGDTPLSFRDDEASSTIAVNGRCGKDADDVPLQSLTQHLFLQFTERQIQDQHLIQLAGREALHTELVAKLDGIQKYFIVIVLKKNGCVYDFLYVARAKPGAQARATFQDFVSGFSTLD